jgi:hypothetical protein
VSLYQRGSEDKVIRCGWHSAVSDGAWLIGVRRSRKLTHSGENALLRYRGSFILGMFRLALTSLRSARAALNMTVVEVWAEINHSPQRTRQSAFSIQHSAFSPEAWLIGVRRPRTLTHSGENALLRHRGSFILGMFRLALTSLRSARAALNMTVAEVVG